MSSLRARRLDIGLSTGADVVNNLIISQNAIPDGTIRITNGSQLEIARFNTINGVATFNNLSSPNSITAPSLLVGTGSNRATIAYTTNSARTFTLPDVSSSFFVMSEGNQTINGNKTFNGTVSFGTAIGSINGNSATSTILQTSRTINGTSFNGSTDIVTENWGTSRTLTFSGDVIGFDNINGGSNRTINLQLSNTGVTADKYNTANVTVDAKGRITAIEEGTAGTTANNGTLSMTTSGSGISGSATFTADQATNSTFTVNIISATTNTGNTLVFRDASGNFSAGTITATLNGSASSVANTLTRGTGLTGNNYNGSAASTWAVSYGDTQGTACQGNDGRLSNSRQASNTLTQLLSLGVGTSATGTTGQIVATNNITAYSSDKRLKKNIVNLTNSLSKIKNINGVRFDWNVDFCNTVGFEPALKTDVGFIAQEIQAILPEAVALAPFDRNENQESKSGENYLTIRPEIIIPLLVEAIKEQQKQIEAQGLEIEKLKSNNSH
jgi:hypothetical protein